MTVAALKKATAILCQTTGLNAKSRAVRRSILGATAQQRLREPHQNHQERQLPSRVIGAVDQDTYDQRF